MRRTIALTLMLLVVGIQTAGAITASQIRWGQDVTSNMASNTLRQWTRDIEGRVAENLGTGNIFYVDSNVTVEGDGKSWTNARNTLDEAVGLCTPNNGDVIYVAQGHNESIGTVADGVDLDVAGITVIGCGKGSLRPTFDYDDDVTGAFAIGANNVTIIGLNFLPSVTDVNEAIEIEAAGDYALIYDCWFMNGEASGTDEFLAAIDPAALATNVTIANCRFESYGGAGANAGIELSAGVNADLIILGNYFNGDYALAPIYSDNDVHTRAWIEGNVCQNTNSGDFGIEFGGAATGVLIGNKIYTDAVATAIDPGSLSCFGNLIINTIDLSAYAFPPLPAIGTVTAGSADDILAKLYYTSDGTETYPATAANDSTVSKIIAKGSTATASTFDNSTDSLEAISDAVRTSFAAFTNPNYLGVSTGIFNTTGTWSTVASHEIAAVTGMVRMIIIPECTASVSSVSDTGTIALGDETTTNSIIAASTLGSGVMVTGELWTDATLTRTILTQTQINGTTIVVANGKDIGYTVATNALSGGSMKFHIWWIPLDATGAVIAGAGGAF